MKAIINSNPPFIINTYKDYFTISENLKSKDEIRYYYKNIERLETQKGELNWLITLGNFFIGLVNTLSSAIKPEKDYDELIIIYKNGKQEVKYLESGSLHLIQEVLKHIQSKLQNK